MDELDINLARIGVDDSIATNNVQADAQFGVELLPNEADDVEFDDCLGNSSDYEFEEEEEESSSLDDEESGKVALALDPSQLSASDGPPQNGHDYLRLVREERERLKLSQKTKNTCDAPKVANQPPLVDSPLGGQSSKKAEKEEQSSNNSITTDDLKYRDEILVNFRNLREKIDEIRASISPDGQINQKPCDEEQLNRSEKKANGLLKLMELGHPPQVSSLISKSQLEIHLTLEGLADQCELKPNYSTLHTDWIYSLMAALREPIEPDICSTLRRLARLCISRRKIYEEKKKVNQATATHLKNNESQQSSELEANEEEEYTSSLLVICIVRNYFGQIDLK